jgi:arginase
MKMPRRVAVIGAPSSAGAFAPGPEEAPAALRAAGLIDLNTPQDNTSGALGWMGNAHLLGCPGAIPQLVELDDGPVLEPGRLILLGASPTRSRPAEQDAIDALGIQVIAEADVAADPDKAAASALARIGNAPYALHFDSDCIDFADLPICENTDRNVGLKHQTAFQALSCAAAGSVLQTITVTQITPITARPTAQQ